MVITRRTRNAVVRKGTWVRIPPSPPLKIKLHRKMKLILIKKKVGFERAAAPAVPWPDGKVN